MIALLSKKAARRFDQAKSDANLLHFDELHVLKTIKQLYKELKLDNEQVFLELAQEEYRHVKKLWALPGKSETPTKKWLIGLLSAYNAVTKYVYENEVDRKRDYTAEAVVASPAKVDEFRRGLSYWAQFTAQAAEDVTDETTLKVYRDSGVERVRWITQEDGKVCEVCRKRDGKVYPIHRIPPKPHRRCRCHYEPVKNGYGK